MIKWKSKLVRVADIDPTPKNYKIANALGKERLQLSLKKFGLAGNVVLNYGTKGRWVLIDGNSRLIEAKAGKEKMIWASIPNKPLNAKEFKEMSAMFDYAKAGDVDEDAIKQDLGTSKDFFNQWGMQVPASMLDKLGANAKAVMEEKVEKESKVESVNLRTKFIEPPFSVLDTKQGSWQQRKTDWLALGIVGELGRGEELHKVETKEGEKLSRKKLMRGSGIATKKYSSMEEYHSNPTSMGTSVFDPVLCELMYEWFCPVKGTVLDPFAGGSVRGIVANYLGRRYFGIDLSTRQINANRKQALQLLSKNNQPTWYDGDSDKLLSKKWAQKFDFILSCPPYVDLEVYSKHEDDLSNMDYKKFLVKYRSIIKKSLALLKSDRYACFVVSEVRDKGGFYYDFVGDTKRIFMEEGAKLYNDAVLLNMIGSASMRADKQFSKSKKLVRIHQNVLIFYKP
jgi:DNA modification methylase